MSEKVPMKEIVVISGKGGTGKTSVTASFAALADGAVFIDADVDAPNLALVLPGELREEEPFSGGLVAVSHPAECVQCGLCRDLCRFEAIDEEFIVDPGMCEGCKLCSLVCPTRAIEMVPRPTGQVLIYATNHGTLVSARLPAGEENSGKLVTQVRKRGRALAEAEAATMILVDGPPGIGCPVIASLTGSDLAVLVCEPGVSGAHDLFRALDLASKLRVPAKVVINKWDLHPDGAAGIRAECAKRGVDVIGQIPVDRDVVEAVVAARPVVEHSDGPAARAIREIWQELESHHLDAVGARA